MANRRPLIVLLLLPAALGAELIKFSLLAKPAAPLQVRKDIFALVTAVPVNAPTPMAQANPPPPPERSVADEIRQSVVFEGTIVRNNQKSAMISASGEYFVVHEGDVVLEKIKILAISPSQCTVEFEGKPYVIYLKGASDAAQP